MNRQQTVRPTGRQQFLTIGLLLLLLLLAFGLRFYDLDAQSLWNDEGTSVAVAQRELATIVRDAAHDIHPPLYYLLLGGWVRLFGISETAVRSLSALLGVVLVALIYVLGRLLAGRWPGLAAAFLAAINPFQVYYSQEARMYMLLAVLTAGAVLALLSVVRRGTWFSWVVLILLEIAGLYSHYSFLFIVLVLNLAYVLQLRFREGFRPLVLWVGSQLAVLLLYLPWLPIALRQVTTWPTRGQTVTFLPALANTWRWLIFGPTVEITEAIVPLLVSALLAAFGAFSLGKGWVGKPVCKRGWSAALSILWVVLPVLLMLTLGLYRVAYLKFLLVTTPAVVILLACGLLSSWKSTSKGSRFTQYALPLAQLLAALLILVPSAQALRNYYAEPSYARDDYRGIAAYIEAVSRPGDVVLLNAPGQQEVFAYYYHGDLPIHPLPESRPLDPATTEAALVELAQPGARVFAVLWATDESDPERFIEGWLDRYAYKALDSWYGNVRLVIYAVPERMPDTPDHLLNVPLFSPGTGDEITLVGYSLLDDRLAAGQIAQITLFWQADQMPKRRYKVFLHVLDEGNHIVGQQDAEPGGGVRWTTLWEPGEVVADNHGVPIHPATPPGEYRVEVGMYDLETGQRLITPEGEGQVWLESLAVERPLAPAPLAALGMQHVAGVEFGALSLLGYDTHKLGFAHQPDVALRPGDVLHVNLYWQAVIQPGGDWQLTIDLLDAGGQEWAGLLTEPVGGYPTSHWQAGDVWRGQFNLALPGDALPGRYELRIQLVAPDGTPYGEFLSEPVSVVR